MSLAFELRGGGGEPIDLRRTFASHGVAELPPFRFDDSATSLTVTLALGGSARTVIVAPGPHGRGTVTLVGSSPTTAIRRQAMEEVRRILRLDEDLSGFYARARRDPALVWACRGAGRMIRSQTVFEEVVKTICTTNCAWSATERMVGALVEHLGKRAPGAPRSGVEGRTFPTAESMAKAGEDFYREVVRAGYRGPYLGSIASSVADGELDLQQLESDAPSGLTDDEVEQRLLALPGVGPYAAAHVMMMLGRYSRLILDSWTRPKYARLVGRKQVSDTAIQKRFKPYKEYAGLAFWLFLTKDWLDDEERPTD